MSTKVFQDIVIVHCTRKLAARLPDVSSVSFEETGPLGSWHANLYAVDHRQCVLFCHDASRYVLFLPGLREPQFQELGCWRCDLFLASLATEGATEAVLKRIKLVRRDSTRPPIVRYFRP